jgi:hypothetical protein
MNAKAHSTREVRRARAIARVLLEQIGDLITLLEGEGAPDIGKVGIPGLVDAHKAVNDCYNELCRRSPELWIGDAKQEELPF